MFRKSAATLFNFSKTVRVTPAVSQTFQRGYLLPAEKSYVSSKDYVKIVRSVDKKEANEAYSLSAAIAERSSKIKELASLCEMLEKDNSKDKERLSLVAERSSKIKELASLCEMLDRDNAKDKERLSSVELYTDEKAKAIIERSKYTEAPLITAFREALFNESDVCEFSYIPGEHLSFLQTVLDEFRIKLVIYKHTEAAGKGRGWCELHLPAILRPTTKEHLGDEHPIYKPWLDNFRDQISDVIIQAQKSPSARF